MCELTHWYAWHDSFTCVTRHIHMRDMMHSYVRHDSLCVTWLMQGGTTAILMKWLVHMCDMTHSYTHSYVSSDWFVWHDSFLRVTWLIPMCDMTHSYVWHDSCRAVRLPFCEELIKGVTCNLLMPPCDGDGSQVFFCCIFIYYNL